MHSTDTLADSHRAFAKSLNQQVWELLEKPARSAAEDDLLLNCAHASCYHWRQVGTGLHHQRAVWLIARVYTVLGLTDAALRFAARCLELTHQHAALMEDFDRAYAYEALARANALAQNTPVARQYLALAEEAGQEIENDEDKSIFLGDLNGGNWYGVR